MVAGDRLLWALFNAFPHRLAAAIRICLQILVPNEVTSVMYQEDILGYNIERKGFITAERRSLQALNRVCDGRAKVITGSSQGFLFRLCNGRSADYYRSRMGL